MIRVPYFDNAIVEIVEEIDPSDMKAAAALKAFLSLTEEDRLADSRHVYAYYKDFHEAVGGEDWLDEEMGIPQTPADIWAHVTPGDIEVQQGWNGDDNWYVSMEANCSWEVEHGLMMVWRNGTALTKVGGYDGHLTNVNAFADPTLEDVVYSASDPKYTTRLSD
ncbi:DUF6985 domain-containing protein [Paenibacillus sp. JDR-2]|uniref:DUF6985 domain-containing protein n=1 Tax=Paenibacillus sp. (strain JDR-2) TaxID=324057 RepID=UPI0001666A84|nr:hypothetical protein [Paenibacillus sp. JDR-2]ACT03144.1 conserved hypothetical protein [Paenibacillus sp. JDR-2]